MPNKIIEDKKFAAIIDSLCFWLGYQFKIGREQLIHEASLRYPIADTITSGEISINKVVLEQLHPFFKSKKIDLVIYENNVQDFETEPETNKIKEVYEFKLAKIDTSKEGKDEHQRVFDDVVRLGYYDLFDKKASNSYFLMCGKYSDFKTFFIGQDEEVSVGENGRNLVKTKMSSDDILEFLKLNKWESKGLYKDWFDFRIGGEKEKKFEISDPNNDKEWGLKAFQQSYHIRDEVNEAFTSSITIKTTCMAITPNEIGKGRTHAAGIWKIECID